MDDAATIATRLLLPGATFRSEPVRRGLGWRNLAWLEEAGQVVRLARGVVGSGLPPTDLPSRLQRAEVLVGRPLIAWGQTAAQLHGFGVLDDGMLHVTTADGWSAPMPPGIVVHQCVPRSAPVERSEVLATEPADTAVDLACARPDIDTLAVLDAALRAKIDPEQLSEAMDRAARRRGIIKVRRWMPFADWRADSPMESRTRYRFLAAGLPPPDLQIAVRVGPNSLRYIDMGWRVPRIGVDYDGEQFHGTEGLAGDRRRHNELTHREWRMFYPTSVTVFKNSPGFVAAICRSLGVIPRPHLLDSPDRDDIPRPAGRAADLLTRPRSAWSPHPVMT